MPGSLTQVVSFMQNLSWQERLRFYSFDPPRLPCQGVYRQDHKKSNDWAHRCQRAVVVPMMCLQQNVGMTVESCGCQPQGRGFGG
mmetsp:Transcript_15420/g.49514  ORF Transcript_15420/g.49514 Transcript_15420/m.49514 type:complete len:85 (+) Transcript_15420:419-673(+)